jgi:CheY-like chemotaxis protein
MQSTSSWAPKASNCGPTHLQQYSYGLRAETANWIENPSEHARYRDPRFCEALAVDPIRILIVADFGPSIQIAALVHAIGRFETRIACSADAALKIARYFLPNIVLMSTDLPDLASYPLASALRWHSRLPSPRLIALTDDIPGTDRRRALEVGFEQYLTLPVQQAALESVLVPRPGSHQRRRDLRTMRIRHQRA